VVAQQALELELRLLLERGAAGAEVVVLAEDGAAY
jgi:hypothetical protein